MNGKLNKFCRTRIDLPDKTTYLQTYIDAGLPMDAINAAWDKILEDEVYINDQYQVHINKNVDHGLVGFTIWHFSIKRLDREVIHDWRDLQEIKNLLAGPEFEAIELYPSESRKVDSANQYHLWVFITANGEAHPQFPVGWTTRFVSDDSLNNSLNRKL